ncbi:S41 family peptidase [Psychrobacter phenylpyruvicus]|uniref:Probable CtpA-like serine protease n=1 Tax=Psychrobacter phenylpyruvicus TaxID=29432 RepID=A0A379LKA0_9GAMM|nr:S41 family peptidase [Psychrobacter phenylpyruvicus]SUD90973.1 Probable CtpA-like serine protease [Psychrobacter phenylpyruvicus]
MQFDSPQNLAKNKEFIAPNMHRLSRLNGRKFSQMASLALLSLTVTISGCSTMGQPQSSEADNGATNSVISQSGSNAQPQSEAAKKLNDLAITAKKSEAACVDDCGDVNAIAPPDDEVVSYEDIDSQPVFIDDLEQDDLDNEIEGERLGVEHVPLNAISPQTLQAFVEVIDVIRHDYVRPVNDEMLFQHAITGMLEKLDKHAEYLTPESYDNLRNFTDGEIAQVGLVVKYNPDTQAWEVSSVLSQSSAQQAGIKSGDRLLRIKNAELTSDMTEQDVQQLLSGIAGSQVEVTITNAQGGSRRNITLQRNLAANNELTVTVKDTIAIIRLPVFQNGSKNQLINALKQTGTAVTGVVIDVRNNPGGVLSSAIDIASLFIKEGDLIQVRSRTNSAQLLKPKGKPYLSDLPVIVLQNRYSASAAEVLASSFKSNKRAKIVGEQSFGKGTVQEVVPLESGGGIKLTVAEYRSAKGELIDGVGVKPDMVLAHDGSDWQQTAVKLLLSQDRPLGIKFDTKFDSDGSILNDY